MKPTFYLLPFVLLLLSFSNLSLAVTQNNSYIDEARIINADTEPHNWLAHGRDYSEQRFSPLSYINDSNVDQLGLSWFLDTQHHRGLEATPIVVDGTMYVSSAWSSVYALDAVTGRQLWYYDAKVPRATTARKICCDAVNRGVAVWKDRVFVATLDGRLVALDAATGAEIWSTLTVDPNQAYTSTGATRVVKDKVIIGNSGAEYGVRGYVSAYDTQTGELSWRFYTVPGDPALGFESDAMAMAAKTWSGEWWLVGGGGTAWDSMAYDPELDLLYIGVGNGSPWNRRLRSPGGGDNLFLSSIVAVRPNNGEYVWHYQVVPAETWDYTATQHMILTNLEIEGVNRKVLMQAPKSGFFMVIDRITGKLISAEPFAKVTWASHYDLTTGRPVEMPGQDYAKKSALVRPTGGGAHNWQPMSYSRDTGLVYIPTMDAPMNYKSDEHFEIEADVRNRGIEVEGAPPGDQLFHQMLLKKISAGYLQAWDPIKQQQVWRVDQDSFWNGGVLSTAGNLVMQGAGNHEFTIYNANKGEVLWQFTAQNGVIAPPITFAVNGEQYITVLAGGGGAYDLMSGRSAPPAAAKSRILTFKLSGNKTLPTLPEAKTIPAPPAKITEDSDQIKQGEVLFHSYCSFCHGSQAISGGTVPDLRHSASWHHENFTEIVHGGMLATIGMPGFGDVLTTGEVNLIHAYVVDRAHIDHQLRHEPEWQHRIRRWAYEIITWFVATFLAASSQSA